MKNCLCIALWAVGSLAAIVVIHHWLGERLEYRLTLRYLLLMLCAGGLVWLNLRKHPMRDRERCLVSTPSFGRC